MIRDVLRHLAADNQARSGVFALSAWWDVDGDLWLARLGTPAPDVDEPMPAAWIHVTVDQEADR